MLFKKKTLDDFVVGMDREVLRTILEASKSSYPNEFAALLRAENKVINRYSYCLAR